MLLGTVAGALLAPAPLAAQTALPQIDVIATSPLAGAGLDRDKLAATVQTVTAEDFARTFSANVTDTLMQRIPGVSTTDVQGNGVTQDLRYRGFAASPLPGTPQGIAVYMNGIRINEAFGDTVNWDLIPTNAIDRADVWSNNPVFGLNALGGAVSLQTKTGFSFHGVEADLTGGSFGRAGGSFQYGAERDGVGLYVAAQGLRDDGWRFQSPTRVARVFGDLGWKSERSELHLSIAGASNDFGVVGPTPTELVDRDYKSIYTWPQTTANDMGMVSLRGKAAVTDHWSVQGNLYARKFSQRHVDGNTAEFEDCGGAFPGQLCRAGGGSVVLDRNGNTIPFLSATTPYGTIDRTFTNALTVGGSAQATSDAKLLGHGNHVTAGVSLDHSRVDFRGDSELGKIFPNLFVGPDAGVPGTGQIIHTQDNVGYAPVGLDARNTYVGIHATDTFDITERLSASFGARFNLALIDMRDKLGTSPDLTGDHRFQRLNPVAGLTYRLMPGVSLYGGYSESNRAPTPLELGCANPARPCLLEGFLVSDPPLKQVVSRTYETGLRGNTPLADGRVEWKFGLFRTDTTDDILNLASQIQGRGFFQNVAGTRRQGVEAGLQLRASGWLAYANYSFIDATYRFAGDIASPNNPSADINGNIHVMPGNRIPGIPRHQLKLGLDRAVTAAWKIGIDAAFVSSQYFVGDDANQNDRLPAYWVANLHTTYQVSKDVQLFGLVNNLFNRKYATYGTYFEPQSIANAIANPPTDQRTITPAAPLAVYAGVRLKL